MPWQRFPPYECDISTGSRKSLLPSARCRNKEICKGSTETMRQIHAVNILLSDIPASKKIFPRQTCLANEPFLLYEFVWKAFQGNTPDKKAVDGRAIHRLI